MSKFDFGYGVINIDNQTAMWLELLLFLFENLFKADVLIVIIN